MKVVALADLHAGSRVALAMGGRHKDSPGFEIREKLFKCYYEATKGEWSKPDVLIVDGDAIDGNNKKKAGYGLWTTDLLEQIDEAAELIEMWQAKHVYIVRGSGYHVQVGDTGLQVEEILARKIKNIQQYPESKDYSGFHLYLTVDGVTFHISHKIGTSKVFYYKSTPLAKELLFEKLNSMLRHDINKYRANVIIRAHGHSFIALEYARSAGICLPCWKAVDEFMEEQGAIGFSPDIGFVGFSTNKGTYNWQKILWPLDAVQNAPHIILKEA